jgi:5-methylcytosine-specific restriction endonuclease McrA
MTILELEKRKPLTALQRAKMFREHDGICCICKLPIGVKEKWIDEHERALAMGGGNETENRGPAHVKCAKVKTKSDKGQIAEAKRREAKHIGATRPKQMIRQRKALKTIAEKGSSHHAYLERMEAKGKSVPQRRIT